jgi:hypothetical protein
MDILRGDILVILGGPGVVTRNWTASPNRDQFIELFQFSIPDSKRYGAEIAFFRAKRRYTLRRLCDDFGQLPEFSILDFWPKYCRVFGGHGSLTLFF